MSEVKYKTCPKCGGTMFLNSGGWICNNCGAYETADGKIYPTRIVVDDIAPQPTNSFNWQAFRAEAAKDFVAAILAGGANQTDNEGKVFRTIEEIAKGSIAFADALIKQLKDGNEKD